MRFGDVVRQRRETKGEKEEIAAKAKATVAAFSAKTTLFFTAFDGFERRGDGGGGK